MGAFTSTVRVMRRWEGRRNPTAVSTTASATTDAPAILSFFMTGLLLSEGKTRPAGESTISRRTDPPRRGASVSLSAAFARRSGELRLLGRREIDRGGG